MLLSRSTATVTEKLAVLSCQRLPGRLNSSETAILLGFQEHDIARLVAARLLTPLGKPAKNAPKYFATIEILTIAQDRNWLSRATQTLAKHWFTKNNRKARLQRELGNRVR